MRKGYSRITIDIPNNEFKEFKKVCNDSGKTMSEVLRFAIMGIIRGFTPNVVVDTDQKKAK